MVQEEYKINTKEIMLKLAKLQAEVDILKQKEKILEEHQNKFTVIDESMAEIWDNDEDEIWNEY